MSSVADRRIQCGRKTSNASAVVQSVELAQPGDSGFHAHAEGARVVGREIGDGEFPECSALCLDEDRLRVDERSVEVEGDGGGSGEAAQWTTLSFR